MNRRAWWPWAALVAATAIGAALRLAALGQECLWADEYYTIRTAGAPTLRELMRMVATIEPHPPLFFLVMHGWIGLFGSGDAALRMPSALAGILAIPLMFMMMRRLWPERPGAAALAAFLIAISPMHLNYSQEARAYAMQVTMELAALAALAWGMGPQKRATEVWMPLAAAAAVAAIWFQYYSAFIWLAVLLAIWAARRTVSRRAYYGSLAVMVVGGGAPILMALWRAHGHWGEDLPFMPPSYGPELLFYVMRAQALGPWFSPLPLWADDAVVGVGAALLALGVYELWRGRGERRGGALVIGLALACMLAVPVAVSFVKPIVYYGQRYLVIAVPPVVALLALAATGPRRRIGMALLAVLIAAQGFYLYSYYAHRQKQTWDLVARELDRMAEPGATLWVMPARAVPLLERYLKSKHPVLGADSIAAAAAGMKQSPGPQYVVSYADLAADFARAGLAPGRQSLFETHRPGQELWLVMFTPVGQMK
ncbi:MAG: glycosyltransferase family 39 protein [Candidatus Sumerlaeia bacterium]